jgi:hypothetical protein
VLFVTSGCHHLLCFVACHMAEGVVVEIEIILIHCPFHYLSRRGNHMLYHFGNACDLFEGLRRLNLILPSTSIPGLVWIVSFLVVDFFAGAWPTRASFR